MPLTLRPKNLILQNLMSHLLAGNIVTDVANISVIRQILEAVASTMADLEYDLYTLLQSFYITTAQSDDLDTRGRDTGLIRDPGQAASDPLLFTRTTTWIDDIPLPAPQVLQALLADGTLVRYRTLGDAVLTPSGRSVSGQAPGTTLSGTNDRLALNLDGDGIRVLLLDIQPTGTAIAAAIQTAVRALTANGPSHQSAYTNFRADYSVTTPGAYTLRSGTAGPTSTVVVTVNAISDASATLKLGLAYGGVELPGQTSLSVPVLCDTIGIVGNVAAGQINSQVTPVAGIDTVANPLALANGREPASDDSHRQDVRTWIKSLAPATRPAAERVPSITVTSDGQRHVLSSQVVYGVNTIQAYICDGRSLTVGAQTDILQAVQDEFDGLGQQIGGWTPSGNMAGVAPATILTVHVSVAVRVGPTPDVTRAQAAMTAALFDLLYNWPVGQALSSVVMQIRLDQTVVEVLNILFTLPTAFSTTPPTTVGGLIGQKIMPGMISVIVSRAS